MMDPFFTSIGFFVAGKVSYWIAGSQLKKLQQDLDKEKVINRGEEIQMIAWSLLGLTAVCLFLYFLVAAFRFRS